MLFINNEVVKSILKMSECIDALEEVHREIAAGDAVDCPRRDLLVPCGREDAYYRFTSMAGGSKRLGVVVDRVMSI